MTPAVPEPGPFRLDPIESIYLRVCDMPAPIGAAFLREVCGADRTLYRQVSSRVESLPVVTTGTTVVSGVSLPSAGRIGRRLAEFYRAGEQRFWPDLTEYVPPLTDPLRTRTVVELVRLDQKSRWAAAHPLELEACLSGWTELADRVDLQSELLATECLLRQLFATPLESRELASRFPRLANAVDLSRVARLAETFDATGGPRPGHRTFGVELPPRFSLVRKLGMGGMGVVFEARDVERGTRVAIKTLSNLQPSAIYRFKREFRALQGLTHQNLIPLYEFISDGNTWFFTMELVDGVDFLTWVRRRPTRIASDAEDEAVTSDGDAGVDEPRLRSALRQLVHGVSRLHESGVLHRDIKPTNVIVRPNGHVLLLDFGLVKELKAPDEADEVVDLATPAGTVTPPWTSATWTGDHQVLGSVPYMSPEQSAGLRLTEASDWYAVGVMLYEALAGVRPFRGSLSRVHELRQREDPTPPVVREPNTPADLNQLCMALLHRDPSQRATGRDILACVKEQSAGSSTVSGHQAPSGVFVGRAAELAQLRRSFDELRAGRTVAVHIHGHSGAGKSALVHQFLQEVTRDGDAVLLSGRCYEQESVPYKALDALVDSLCRYLLHLSPIDSGVLMPRDIAALARVFPVLNRVQAVSAAASVRHDIPDVQELRRRAFGALAELLQRIGDRHPLVLYVDDLQWGDIDSAALLTDLLTSGDPPRLILLVAYRSEYAASNACLIALKAAQSQQTAKFVWFEIPVNPLNEEESRDLATALLGTGAGDRAGRAALVAREAGGNPFFIYELAKHVQTRTDGGTSLSDSLPLIRLEDVLWSRLLALPAPARQLLEVIAVAGKPVPLRNAAEAAGLTSETDPAVVTLRGELLVNSTGPGLDDAIATYHDRIRESVAARLDDQTRRRYHLGLATSLERSRSGDMEAIASHFERAGETARAAEHYVAAGDRAAAALAFERCAELYRVSLRLRPLAGPAGRLLRRKLGDALANAGRSFDAAQEYQRVSQELPEEEALELQRLAGYQYCISGHIDEGRQAFGAVLAFDGLTLRRTRGQALLSILARRARLWLRGIGFNERTDVPRQTLDRLDRSWSVATGMTIIDPIRGADYQTHNLIEALRAGEPYRISRALAWESAHLSMAGIASRPRADRQLAVAESLASRLALPHAVGMARMSRGVSAFFYGQFAECQRCCEEAAQLFRDHCTGVAWERETCNAFAFWAVHYQGHYAELSRRYGPLVQEARSRGARLAEADFTTFGGPFVHFAADDAERVRTEVEAVMRQWSQQDFQVQHYTMLTALTQADLYSGNYAAAWERITAGWAGVRGAMLLHVEIVRIYMLYLRARCALGQVRSGTDRDRMLKSAALDARRLARERPPYARAFAGLVDAAVAAWRDRPNEALRQLDASAAAFEDLGIEMYAAPARRWAGVLRGGDEGRAAVAQVDAALAVEGVRNPAALAALQVQGFPVN